MNEMPDYPEPSVPSEEPESSSAGDYEPVDVPPVSAPPPSAPPGEKKSNTGLIIAIVVAVVLLLCCCCSVAGIFLWNNGDQILNNLGMSLLPIFGV